MDIRILFLLKIFLWKKMKKEFYVRESIKKERCSKGKLFVENFLIYGFGGIISKIIPLIMVPIITRIMPDSSYYGISDLSNTVLSFASALAVMGMYDAMYRMFFEKEDMEFKKDICSTALVFTLGTSLAVFIMMILLKDMIAKYAFGNTKYFYLVYITAMAALVSSTNNIISAPTRMQNQRKVFLIMNTLSPVLSYSISIPLLLRGHYMIALPLASLVCGFISEILFYILNREWFSLRRFHKEYLKSLLLIAVPLLPNFLIYWIFNSSDRLMIANILDTAAAGLYSVGSKLGHVSQLIYTAFAGGWQFFAFSTMKENGQVKTNSVIFEYLGLISFSCTVFIFALSKPVYQFLFTDEYVSSFIIAPYLFLAPLLQMLFQVAANQFLVVKKTWPNFFILSAGAVVNVFLNLWLIPKIGIEGAAIATLAGYAISDVVCVVVLCRMKLHRIRLRFIFSVAVMIGYILLWRFYMKDFIGFGLAAAFLCCAVFGFLYREDIQFFSRKIKSNKGERLK